MKPFFVVFLLLAAGAMAQEDLHTAIDDGDIATAKKIVKSGELEEIYCGKLPAASAVAIYDKIFKKMPDESFEQCPSQFSYGYGAKVCANPKALNACSEVIGYLLTDANAGNSNAFNALKKVGKVALANKAFKKPLKEKVDTTMWVPCKKKGKAWKECIEACESYAEEIGDEERLASCKKKPAEYKETTITISKPSPIFNKLKTGIMEGYWNAPMTSAIKFSDLMQQFAKPLSIPDTSIINLKYVVRWAQKHKADSTALPGGQLFRFCTSWESKVDQILDTLQFETRCPVFETFVDDRDGKTYKVKEIDGKNWFVQNLNFEMEEGSICYDKDDENCNAYGRLYTQAAAKAACPDNTHLATDEEWKMLEILAGGASGAATKLRSNGSDDYAFTALFGGYANRNGISTTLGEGAYFWTEKADGDKRGTARSMFSTDAEVSSISVDIGFYLSVRCIKD